MSNTRCCFKQSKNDRYLHQIHISSIFKTFNFIIKIKEDNEAHILPSVREIIRQVEAMTQSNAATSTTDIFTLGLNNGTTGNHSIQKENNQQSQLSKQRKVNSTNDNQFARTGILRQCGSSQRTPSAPQLRTANYGNSQKYTPIQAKFNAAVASNSQNTTAPPVPPHGIARNKVSRMILTLLNSKLLYIFCYLLKLVQLCDNSCLVYLEIYNCIVQL